MAAVVLCVCVWTGVGVACLCVCVEGGWVVFVCGDCCGGGCCITVLQFFLLSRIIDKQCTWHVFKFYPIV